MAWPTVAIDTTSMDAGTDNPALARSQIKQMADNVNGIKDARGAPSGVASLDAGGKVPTTELPTIPATQGGTGQTGFTVGDLLYALSATQLAKLAAGAAGTVLKSNGPGAAPSYQSEGGGFPTGTRMAFQQTAAPTGWTKDTTPAINDSIMRLNTGTVGSGGSLAFSTWAAQTSDGATTLTTAQIPSQTYQIYATNPSGTLARFAGTLKYNDSGINSGTSTRSWQDLLNTSTDGAFRDTNGGGSHTHSLSQNVKYYDFIIASKN